MADSNLSRTTSLVAYVAHLLLPVLLLADLATTWARQPLSSRQYLLGAINLLWLILGALGFALLQWKPRLLQTAARALVAFFSTVIAVAVAESFLRSLALAENPPATDSYYVPGIAGISANDAFS